MFHVGLLRHEHVVAVLAAAGDDQGQLALRAQLADADEGVEALVSVLLDYLDVGGVHPIRGLKRHSNILDVPKTLNVK